MYKIVIHGSPVDPFLQVGVFENKELKDKKETNINNLHLVVFDFINIYSITEINLAGAKVYMQGIQQQLEKEGRTNYSIKDLTFNYV